MPTYLYRCPKDGTEMTAVQAIMDRNFTPICSECGGYMAKAFCPPAVIIK